MSAVSNEPELIADIVTHTGEGPLWHPSERVLYWVDIPAGRLYRFDPRTARHELAFESELAIGGFTIQADGALLLFMSRGAIKLLRNGQIERTVVEDIPEERRSRFNDVIADPRGRVFCGTMASPDHPGTSYRLDLDGSLQPVIAGVRTPNGMGFTPDRRKMYFTDTPTKEISIFDYDEASGALTNRRPFVQTAQDPGGPDGMTVDAEGCVWSARWGGGALVRYAPDGAELQRIAFPALKVSSATFGGDGYSDLYVTTATGGNDREEEGAGAGALFRVRPGVTGVPEFASRVLL